MDTQNSLYYQYFTTYDESNYFKSKENQRKKLANRITHDSGEKNLAQYLAHHKCSIDSRYNFLIIKSINKN